MIKSNPVLYDSKGKPVSSPAEKLKANIAPNVGKKQLGLYGNIYAYPNYGQYRPRFYTLGDSEQGLDSLSRELLVRWSREVTAQMPWVGAAIRLLAQYAVGNEYLPVYTGDNSEWGKTAVQWLREEFYPNGCTRGKAYDFQNCMFLESCLLDQDGDILCLYGKDENGFPKFQMVPSNRVRSSTMDNHIIESGQFAGYMIADGVIYNPATGQAVGYNVTNYKNLASSMPSNSEEIMISGRDAQLIYDARFFDKSRGVPSVGSGILQALSIQELDSYLLQKTKIQSTIALIEKTPSGEAPYELQQTLEALKLQSTDYGVFNPVPNIGGVRIVQGSDVRYIKAEGGDIKTLDNNTVGGETANYIKRLETHILSAIGVPHQIMFSPESVSGRMVSGIVETFRGSIDRRQKILDKHAKFIIHYALSVAMENGYIPRNDTENLYRVFDVTHPKEFTLDPAYDRQADINDYNAGFKSLNDIVSKEHKTAKQVIDERANEAKEFFVQAQKIAAETNTSVETVVAYLRSDLKITIKNTEDKGAENASTKTE